MKNVNDILTQEYFTRLQPAVTPVPVFRDGYVPKDLVQDSYVMVSAINNTDDGAINGDFTLTSIQVGIYTRSKQDNNASEINNIASLIYSTIRPRPINQIFITGFQVLTTELGNDTCPPPFDTGSELFINRFITFNHKIYHDTGAELPILIPPQTDILYGFNSAMNFNGLRFSDTAFLNAIQSFFDGNLNVSRYPGGTIANTFDWETGEDDAGSPFPNTLDDQKALYDAIGCDILFCLNICTKTLENQLAMLAQWKTLTGDDPKYIELGNEINNLGSNGHDFFPTGYDYFATCATWAAAIKVVYPDVLIGICGEDKGWFPTWNDEALAVPNVDALISHIGINIEDFTVGGVANLTLLDNAIEQSWLASGMDKVPNVWVTECNYHFDENNLLSDADAKAVTLFMLQKVSTLLEGKTGTKIFCVRGMVGNQGAIADDLTLLPTGEAFIEYMS